MQALLALLKAALLVVKGNTLTSCRSSAGLHIQLGVEASEPATCGPPLPVHEGDAAFTHTFSAQAILTLL